MRIRSSICSMFRRTIAPYIGPALGISMITPSICLGTDSSNSASVFPTAGNAVKDGDIIYFRSDAPIFQQAFDTDSSSEKLCAPAFSRFEVQSVTAAATHENAAPATGTASSATAPAAASGASGTHSPSAVTTADTQIVVGSFSSAWHLFHFKALPWSFGENSEKTNYVTNNKCYGGTEATKVVDYNVPYKFTAKDFQGVRSQRMGFTWGGLVVPYKFYLNDHSFHSNTAALGYVGYEGYFPGVSLAGVLALGPGAGNTATTTGTSSSTGTQTTTGAKSTTVLTYSAATGVVASFGGAMKLGALIGWDWQGRGSGFAYEGKPWISVSIGAGF